MTAKSFAMTAKLLAMTGLNKRNKNPKTVNKQNNKKAWKINSPRLSIETKTRSLINEQF